MSDLLKKVMMINDLMNSGEEQSIHRIDNKKRNLSPKEEEMLIALIDKRKSQSDKGTKEILSKIEKTEKEERKEQSNKMYTLQDLARQSEGICKE